MKRDYTGAEDPGVQSVAEIYTYYKKFDIPTEVMGASFRNVGQILELAGCDCLTISPELMEELSKSMEPIERKLTPEKAKAAKVDRLQLDEKTFRWMLNDNAMAYEKTGEGIRKFAADVVKLEKFVASKIWTADTPITRMESRHSFLSCWAKGNTCGCCIGDANKMFRGSSLHSEWQRARLN